MTESTGNTPVKIAKINAVQAIVVALITVVGGATAGYWVGNSGSSTPTIQQKWLIIQGIDGPNNESVRVVIGINGIVFAYPADVSYTKIGPNMAEQKIPLPVGVDDYTLEFQAQFRNAISVGFKDAKSRSRPTFPAESLPTERQGYSLHGIIGDEKSAEVVLTVYYVFR
jgi:hypothetical protein